MSIPKRDPNFTMTDLRAAGDHFLEAGYAYWEAMHKSGLDVGAVTWLEAGDKGLAIFTRGEYRETLLHNIPEVGPIYHFGGTADEERP